MTDKPTTRIIEIEREHPELFEHEQKFRMQMKDDKALQAMEETLGQQDGVKVSHITQGYVSKDMISKVRMRLIRDEKGDLLGGFITLKGPPMQKKDERKKRLELEVPIPPDQLQAYGDIFPVICPVTLRKTRYSLETENHKFDVDRYHWSDVAQAAMNKSEALGKHYDQLATVDVEFKDHDDSKILKSMKDFPELLQPFLIGSGNSRNLQEVTHCCSYKSAALAALNTMGNDEKTVKDLLDKIATDKKAGRLASPQEVMTL